MLRKLIFLFAAAAVPGGAVTIDRMAVVVGKHVIKLSDIDRDLRVTEFLNGQRLSEGPEEKRQAAERLVDQEIIRDQLASGGYGRPTDAEADALLKQLGPRRQSLSQYGLTDEQLRAQFLWQLTVLRFIDQRFRAGVLVTDEDIQTFQRQHPGQTAQQARTTLEGEQINKDFESWIAEARKQTHIEFKDQAFKKANP